MDWASVPIAGLLPHGPEMTLIERLIVHTPERTVAALTIGPSSRFAESTGVPAWVGIEYMAQTIAAHAGCEARSLGEPPAIGFLLGTREYESDVPEFPLGAVVTIAVEPLLVDERIASFRCTISLDAVVANAVLNVYRPPAAEASPPASVSAP